MTQTGIGRLIYTIAALAPAILAPVHAQSWPAKPVSMVMPFPPGGGADFVVRTVTDAMSKRIGRPFVVVSKPGAATLVAAQEVMRAEPDGHTILWTVNTTTIVHLIQKTDFDARRDLQPVTIQQSSMHALFVPANSPANSLRELLALAKTSPGKFNYASSGVGSDTQIAMELLKSQAGGLDIVHVPYKGEAAILQGLLGNEVQMGLATFRLFMPSRNAGKIKLLAVGGRKRSPTVPDTPTFIESGVNATSTFWAGYFVPSATPKELVGRIHNELKAVHQIPEVNKVLTGNGEELGTETPEEMAKKIADEVEVYARVVKTLGIKPE